MTTFAHATTPRARQRGVGMLETMVGLLIGFIVILVVYNILSVAEGYRRSTVGASDAQVTGLLTSFVAGRDASNGGAGITMSGSDLGNCINDEGGGPVSALAVTALDAAVRPIPLLITDGGGPGVSDSFISLSGGAPHVMWPVDFTATSAPGTAIEVQSPNGFTVPPPATTPYWAIAMANDATGRCKLLRVVAATLPDAQGRVTLTQDVAPLRSTITYSSGLPAKLLNLGPVGSAARIRYDVNAANATLRTTDLLAIAPVVNPIAQNIVLMKVQYGIDTTVDPITGLGDGVVNCWTPADASVCGDWSVANVRAAPLPTVNQILAVRIGVVVRGDEPDLKLLTDPTNLDLQSQARGILNATRPPVVLFNCSTNNAACQSRVVVPMGGTPTGAANCAPAVICDYWRYRTYETVIPLRNAIYATTTPP